MPEVLTWFPVCPKSDMEQVTTLGKTVSREVRSRERIWAVGVE